MATKNVKVVMKQRTDTSANWKTQNPVLAKGEIGYDETSDLFKIGDGTTKWNDLAYRPGKSGDGAYSEVFNEYTKNSAVGTYSHAEGYNTYVEGTSSHAEGEDTYVYGIDSHAEGYNTISGIRGISVTSFDTTNKTLTLGVTPEGISAGDTIIIFGGNTEDTDGGSQINIYYNFTKLTVKSLSNNIITFDESIGLDDNMMYAICDSNYTDNENGDVILTISSHAEGIRTMALGPGSHAEGSYTKAAGDYSHAEGDGTITWGISSHSEGYGTHAGGDYSHAEGSDTSTYGICSHAEGEGTTASGECSHAEGNGTEASGDYSHAEGSNTEASGKRSHTEGAGTYASSENQHVQGKYNIEDTSNKYAHIVGNGKSSKRSNAHTLDWNGNSWYAGNIKIGGSSYDDTNAKEIATKDQIIGKSGSGTGSEIFNDYSDNTASGNYSHTEGVQNTSTGIASHTEGSSNTASGDYSHAEGMETFAEGAYSHSEGHMTTANGDYSHTEGFDTIASSKFQHVQGILNIEDKNNKYAHIIGNGNNDSYTRSNAHTLDWSGNAWYQGNIKIGGTSYDDTSAKEIATKDDIPSNISDSSSIGGINQIFDSGDTFDFTDKNANATELDSTLTGNITKGATGNYASSFGGKSAAIGKRSHAEGTTTIAKGNYSHAEGDNSVALGDDSHAEGYSTTAKGTQSHTEGILTVTIGQGSHAEGYGSKTNAPYSHVEGEYTITNAEASHAEGFYTEVNGLYSHAEGNKSKVINALPTSSGSDSGSSGSGSSSSGSSGSGSTIPSTFNMDEHLGESAHAEGAENEALGYASHAEGGMNKAYGHLSHVEGEGNITGSKTSTSNGKCAHAEGHCTTVEGDYSHAEGYVTHILLQGCDTKSTTSGAHAEGYFTTAGDIGSHAEGMYTTALSHGSHAEGYYTTATGGFSSHAEGSHTLASKASSHAEGCGTTAESVYQHVQGKYNVSDSNDKYAHIVGNGTSNTRSNAHTLDWNGNAWYAGTITIGGTYNSSTNNVSGAKEVATKEYVDNKLSESSDSGGSSSSIITCTGDELSAITSPTIGSLRLVTTAGTTNTAITVGLYLYANITGTATWHKIALETTAIVSGDTITSGDSNN